jgi:hypothetical protein
VGRRRDVLGGQPDAVAVGVGLGEGVVTPAGRVVGRSVREAQVRACPGGYRGDPAGARVVKAALGLILELVIVNTISWLPNCGAPIAG